MRNWLLLFLLTSLLLPSSGNQQLQDITLLASDGSEQNLEDFKGNVTLIMSMTTSCSSCKLQNTYLKDIQQDASAIVILSVAIDPNLDSLESIKTYKESEGITWELMLDSTRELGIRYDITQYPTLLLFDSSGNLVKRWYGVTPTSKILPELDKYMEIDSRSGNPDQLPMAILQTPLVLIFLVVVLATLTYTSYRWILKL